MVFVWIFKYISLFWNHSFSSRFWVHFRYFLVHLIVWKLLQGSLEIFVLFHLVFDLYLSRQISWLSFVILAFFFKSLDLFSLLIWLLWECSFCLYDTCFQLSKTANSEILLAQEALNQINLCSYLNKEISFHDWFLDIRNYFWIV